MQAPGARDEDRDGGFEHGGWSFPYSDQDFGEAMAGATAATLRLTGSSTTSTSVIIATYEPAGPPGYGSFTLEES